ncbi:adenine-specific DNA methylase, partial [Candidatus Poribacteria bacterium]|nr:adenine-specific DNA methylase [Candidatus Poribacteria bacterium]
MKITRVWSMPNQWTFKIKPIRELLNRYVLDGINWYDPFCGKYSPAQFKNDINPAMVANEHKDAIIALREKDDEEYKGVLLDPPYSLRQISEHYKQAGL